MHTAQQAAYVQPVVRNHVPFVADTDDVRSLYWQQFSVSSAVNPQQRFRMHRLRYRVYCVENPFEDPAEHRNGLEIDPYDSHSIHAILTHRPTGATVGTVRIVLPVGTRPTESFAIQSVCKASLLSEIPLATTGEVSRFCIEKSFRHLLREHHGRSGDGASLVDVRQVLPSVTLGLIQWLVAASYARGITHWCAMMEPQLLRLLARLGIHFSRLGDLVDYHGWRQPCVIELKHMLERMRRERPDVWSVIAQRALESHHA
jgi:N-acyl amino acid synthase of PEP-CTERM/exosortase system